MRGEWEVSKRWEGGEEEIRGRRENGECEVRERVVVVDKEV